MLKSLIFLFSKKRQKQKKGEFLIYSIRRNKYKIRRRKEKYQKELYSVKRGRRTRERECV